VTRSALLRDRSLRALLVAEIVSMTGTQMTWVALPWFVLTTTGSAARMGVVLAAEAASVGLLGLWGGAIADRLGPRRTMLTCDAARAPLMAAIPVLHLAGLLTFPLLLVLVFVYGAFVAPSFGSQRALLAELVHDDALLGEATALLQAARRLTLVLGPVIAGALIGLLGATSLLFVDAATYVFSFAVVALLVRAGAAVPREEEHRSMLAGARFVARDRLLRPWTVAIVGIDVSWNVLFAMLPVLVLTRYGGRPELVGWLYGAFGAGALAGSVIAFRVVGRADKLLLASLAILAQTLPIWLLPLPVPASALVAALALSGFFNPIVNAPMGAVALARTPRAVRASAGTVSIVLTAVLSPLALTVAGLAAGHAGARPILLVAAAAQTLAVFVLAAAAMRERSRLRPVEA
jgi:predicted MFS family arabinose efflux permease